MSTITINFMEMNLTDLVNNILVVKGDESKASMPVGDLVVGQHRLLHLGELLKIRLDILETGGGRQSSNKYLLCPHHQLGVGFPRNCDFGFNQLAVQLMSGIGENFVDTSGITEGDEAESSGSSGGRILHYHPLHHHQH